MAGEAFGPLEGHLLVIQAASHGLRSGGRRFGDLLTDSLKQLGFFQSKAEPQTFMRRSKVGPCCEHLCPHADDLSFAVDDPDKLLSELTKGPFHFKLKGTGPLEFHLGCGFGRDTKTRLFTWTPSSVLKRHWAPSRTCLENCHGRGRLPCLQMIILKWTHQNCWKMMVWRSIQA